MTCSSRGWIIPVLEPSKAEKLWNENTGGDPFRTSTSAIGIDLGAPVPNFSGSLLFYVSWRAAFSSRANLSPTIAFGPVFFQWTILGDSVDTGTRTVGPWHYECYCARNDGKDRNGNGDLNDDELPASVLPGGPSVIVPRPPGSGA